MGLREVFSARGERNGANRQNSSSEDKMTVYKVFYKDYYRKKSVFLGTLTERRKDLRGMSQLESGLKWAKFAFSGEVKNISHIFVIPKEVQQASDTADLSGDQARTVNDKR
jgi:hypothetical protein